MKDLHRRCPHIEYQKGHYKRKNKFEPFYIAKEIKIRIPKFSSYSRYILIFRARANIILTSEYCYSLPIYDKLPPIYDKSDFDLW